MSSTIDQRIVQMKFDNTQFESGAKTSMNTLEKLKSMLSFDKAKSGLDSLQNATKGFTLGNISQGVDEVQLKFNALGVIGVTALQNITNFAMGKFATVWNNTIGQIKSGGMNRALNLEQARFSMQGLLKDAEKVEAVVNGPVNNAVMGTAYGLDEAAKAASNFIASGIDDLGDLEQALKSISGSAAQTGASYSEIAQIYTRIAGNGRVYAIDLQSFAARGVNAAAALGTALGKTEQEVRDMVSAGKIDFQTFSNAMYEAFGENAFRANETFSGALSNMKAALSRLGAKFYTPYLNNMRDLFNALRTAINAVSAALDPAISVINRYFTLLTDFAVEAIGKFEKLVDVFNRPIDRESFFRGAVDETKRLEVVSGYLGKSIKETSQLLEDGKIKVSQFYAALYSVGEEPEFLAPIDGYFAKLAYGLNDLAETAKNFGLGFVNIFKNVVSPVIKGIGAFIDSVVGKDQSAILSLVGLIEKISETFKSWTDRIHSSKITEVFDTIISKVNSIHDVTKDVADLFKNTFRIKLSNPLENIDISVLRNLRFGEDLDVLGIRKIQQFSGELRSSFDALSDSRKFKIQNPLEGMDSKELKELYLAGEDLEKLAKTTNSFLTPLKKGFENLGHTIRQFFDLDVGKTKLITGIQNLKKSFDNFKSPELAKSIGELRLSFKNLFQEIGDIIGGIGKDKNWNFWSLLGDALTGLAKIVDKMAGPTAKALSFLADVINGLRTPFELAFKAIGKVISGIAGILTGHINIFEKAGDILGKVGEKIQISFEKIKEAFDTPAPNATGLLAVFAEGGIIYAIYKAVVKWRQFTNGGSVIDGVKNLLSGGISGLIGEVVKSLDNLRQCLFEYTKKLKAETLKEIAIAIGIMSASLIALTLVDQGKLLGAIGVLTTLMGALMGVMAIFTMLTRIKLPSIEDGLLGPINTLSKSFGEAFKMKFIGTTVIKFAVGIGILALALKLLSTIDSDKMQTGLIGLVVIMGAVTAMAFAMSNIESDNFTKASKKVIPLAIAIGILGLAIKMIGGMDSDAMSQGLLGIMAIMGALTLMAFLMSHFETSNFVKAASSMIPLAIAMNVFVIALKQMTKMDPTRLLTAIMTMGIILAELAIVLNFMDDLDNTVSSGFSILIIAAAMVVLGKALTDIGSISWAGLAKGLIAITVVLAEITFALAALSDSDATSSSVAILAISAALFILAKALTAIGQLSLGELLIGLAGITASLLLLWVAIQAFEGSEKTLLAVAGAMTLFGVGVAALALGIAVLTPILVTFTAALIASGVMILKSIGTLGEALVVAISVIIQSILLAIQNVAPILFETIGVILEGVFSLVITYAPMFTIALGVLLESLLTIIIDYIPNIVIAGLQLILGLLQGIRDNIGQITVVAIEILTNFIDAVASKIPDIINSGIDLMISFIDGLAQGIVDNADRVMMAVENLVSSIVYFALSALQSLVKHIPIVGEKAAAGIETMKQDIQAQMDANTFEISATNMTSGMETGVSKGAPGVVKEAERLNEDVLEAMEGDTNTPLKHGGGIVSQFTTGITDKSPEALKAAKNLNLDVTKNIKISDTDLTSIGSAIPSGVARGIYNNQSSAINAASNMASRALRAAKAELDINSPSGEFEEVGYYSVKGLANALLRVRPVVDSAKTLAQSTLGTVTDALAHIDDIDTGIHPVITPVMDLAGIQNGVNSMNGLLYNNADLTSSIAGRVSTNLALEQSNAMKETSIGINNVSRLLEDFIHSDNIAERLERLFSNGGIQIVLDSGELVGSLASDIDNSLGDIAVRRARG